jgi:hypothetical protein
MNFHQFDRPVINLHELTNGLVKYHSAAFDQEILGKKSGQWGYYQSLEQIVELLASVNHYKTSRLAHYHIRNRQDTIEQQIPFYQYLNDNFYIISCRRHNVFEHALSWCLSKITKKLNVYTADEKIDNFFDLYKTGVDIDPNSLIQTLNAYQDYIKWCNDHFNVANYFYYDEHLPRIEQYILSLPIFSQQQKQLTWQDKFDMSFDTWNRCHHVSSDLGTLALDSPEVFAQLSDKSAITSSTELNFLLDYQRVAGAGWPTVKSAADYRALPTEIQTEVEQVHQLTLPASFTSPNTCSVPNLLPENYQEFLNQHNQNYQSAMVKIDSLVDSGVLVSSPPIKKQTLAEKKHIIRNYNHLLEVYNQWISLNPDIGVPLESTTLDQFAQAERTRWNPVSSVVELFDQLPIEK